MRLAPLVGLLGVACGRVHFDARGDSVVIAHDVDLGDAPVATSCAELPAICGPTGTDNCCETLPVPGGTFLRDYDVADDGMFTSTNFPATVSPFWLDKYEVTVSRYRKFVLSGRGTMANPPATNAGARTLGGVPEQGGWQDAWNANLPADIAAQRAALACDPTSTWTDSPGANEALPINCISWYDAMAFCTWDGGWLPTEAEWNFAASGGSEQRAYPWSSPPGSLTVDCAHANYYDCTRPSANVANRVGSRSPLGDGRWGHADLAGNVWEWTLDLEAPYTSECTDCAQLTQGSDRIMRGGYFNNESHNLRAAQRSNNLPETRQPYLGVRCARR